MNSQPLGSKTARLLQKYHLGSKDWRRLDLQKLWKFLSIIKPWATYSCLLPLLFFARQGPNVIYLAFGLFWSNCLSTTTSGLTLSEDSCTFDLVLFNLRAVRMAQEMLTKCIANTCGPCFNCFHDQFCELLVCFWWYLFKIWATMTRCVTMIPTRWPTS